MELSWLDKELTVEEIEEVEKRYLLPVQSDDRLLVKEPLPFGEDYFKWRRWKNLIEKEKNNERYYGYQNHRIFSYGYNAPLAGRWGYALVVENPLAGKPKDVFENESELYEDDLIIDYIQTAMS